MPWLALTVEVEGAAAEAFTEALLEAGARSVDIDEPEARLTCVTAVLDPTGDAQELLRAACRACGIAPVPACQLARLGDEDWVRRSQSQFAPVSIGARLWVGPRWHAPPEGMTAVRIDPGLAFGTGSHASTRLCLEFLVRTLRGGERVLDYGCGSGILAIAAAKLGASRVDAVDLDPQALEAARENAHGNGVAIRAVPAEALEPALYDVVVSNILAQPLIVLAPLLEARIAPGGRIALSGILESQAPEVLRAYSGRCDMKLASVQDHWALLEGRRR